jgi:hypothetical protein
MRREMDDLEERRLARVEAEHESQGLKYCGECERWIDEYEFRNGEHTNCPTINKGIEND